MMWLRKTVHKVAPEGIVYRGIGEEGQEVLMCEVLAEPGDEQRWARLQNEPERGVWGLLDVQKLPSGRYLLVSALPDSWTPVTRTDIGQQGPARPFGSADQFIMVQGELIALPMPWFQHPGQMEVHQQTPTLPTPLVSRLHLPLLERLSLPGAVVVVILGWVVAAWLL